MKNKKAFEVQFNWIFVLIAGAAILILVSFIIFKQKNLSESSSNSLALRSIESVISGTSVSTDTSSLIEVPDCVESEQDYGCQCIAGACQAISQTNTHSNVNNTNGANIHSSEIACATDVRSCSDGSYVKRVPPTCEFADCPSGTEMVPPVLNQ